jgi:acetyl-CoA acetyltransferase
MAVTRAEIANRALRRAGRLAYGQTAESTLSNAALQAYDEVYDYLERLGIVDWGSTASVPNEYVPWVVAMTAYNKADEWGISNERFARIAQDANAAEREIRRLFNDYYTTTEVKVKDY